MTMRIVYSALALVFFAAAIFVALSPLGMGSRARNFALAGVVLGAAAAFLLVYVLFLSTPDEGTPWAIRLAYGLLAAPLGAILGGTLGMLAGRRR